MSALEPYNGRSSKSTSSALCASFNKLQVRNSANSCFYEDYLLRRTKFFLFKNYEVHPSIPSKFGDIVQNLKKFLQDAPLTIRRSKQCIEDFYGLLMFLQDYVGRYVEVCNRYPLTQDLFSLLIEYVEVEYEVLYFSDNCSAENQKEVEKRILNYLLMFLCDSTEKKGTKRKDPEDCSAIYALYVIKNVKADYKREHDLIENLMSQLLIKLKVFDAMNAIRGENVDSNNTAKLLQDPRLQEISNVLQNCSNINDTPDSEDEIHELYLPRPRKVKSEEIDVKVNISQVLPLNVEENLNCNSDDKKVNIRSNNSNMCKCGHYNCGISCVDQRIMYISDDEDSSDVVVTEEEPLPIIDLDVDEEISDQNKNELLVKNETLTASRNNSTIGEEVNEIERESIKEKVDLSQHVHLNNDDRTIVVLLSDDEDGSDVVVTEEKPLPIIDLEVDEEISDHNKNELLVKNETLTASCNNSTIGEEFNEVERESIKEKVDLSQYVHLNNDVVLLSDDEGNDIEITGIHPVHVIDLEIDKNAIDTKETTETETNKSEMCTSNKNQEIATENLLDRITEKSTQDSTIENQNDSIPTELLVESHSSDVERIEDIDFHENISETVNTVAALEDEETHNELSKNIIDQLESAIQDSESNLKDFRQTIAIESKTPLVNEDLRSQVEEAKNANEQNTETELVNDPANGIQTEEVSTFAEHVETDEVVTEIVNKHVDIGTEIVEPPTIVTEHVEEDEIVHEHVEAEAIFTDMVEPEQIVNDPVEVGEIVSEVVEPEEIVHQHIEAETVEPEQTASEAVEQTVSEIVESEEIVYAHVETEANVTETVEQEQIVNEPVAAEGVEPEETVLEHIESEPIVEPEQIVNESVEPEEIVYEAIEPDEIVYEHIEAEPIVNESVEAEETISEGVEPKEYIEAEPIVEPEQIVNESVEAKKIISEGIEPEEHIEAEPIVEPEQIANESVDAEKNVSGPIEPEQITHIEAEPIVNETVEAEEIISEGVEPEKIVHEHIKAEPKQIVNESVDAEEIVSEIVETEQIVYEHVEAELMVEPEHIVNEPVEAEEIVSELVEPEASVNEHIDVVEEVVEHADIPNDHVETEEIIDKHVNLEARINTVSEHVEPTETVNEHIESEEIVTYAISQDLVEDIVVEEIHTSVVIHEEIVESEHFEDEKSSLNDSGVFESSPSGDTERSSTYSCDLSNETPVQDGNENSADNEIPNAQLSDLHFESDHQLGDDCVNECVVETVEVKSECIIEGQPDCLTSLSIIDSKVPSDIGECMDKENLVEFEETLQPAENASSNQLKQIDEDKDRLPTTQPNNEVFSTNLDVLANAASGCFKNTDDFQPEDETNVNESAETENLPEPTAELFAAQTEPKLDEHISDDYVHEETVVTSEPCEIFTEQNCSNYLVVLATAAAKRKKVKSVHVRSTRKNKRVKKIKKKEIVKEIPSRRVTRSSTISKRTIPNNDVQDSSKCIPSTFMNLENLVTPPPICVYNMIPTSITDDDSTDEPFSSVKTLQEILVRNVAYDEDTLDDNITLVQHEKENESEVIISIPETEKDYPGINYDILKEAEEFSLNTNLSLSTSEELCKELKLTMTKNKESQQPSIELNLKIVEQSQLKLIDKNETLQKIKKKVNEKIVHTVPIKKRRNYEKSNLDITNNDKEQIVKCGKENPAITETVLDNMPEEKLEKRSIVSDKPFPTKAALKCFQTANIKCNPYVQLQKLPVICDVKTVIENEQRKIKNREKPEPEAKPKESESHLKQRKTRRGTIDCLLDSDIAVQTRNFQKNDDTKITRRRASAKLVCEVGSDDAFEIDPIVEKEEVTVKPKPQVHDEKIEENTVMQTRSKSNRNRIDNQSDDHPKNREESDLVVKPIVEQDKKEDGDGQTNKNDLADKTPIKSEGHVELKSKKKLKKKEKSTKTNKRNKSSLKSIEIKNTSKLLNDQPLVKTISDLLENVVSTCEVLEIKPDSALEIDINKTEDSNSTVQNNECEPEIQENAPEVLNEAVALLTADTNQLAIEKQIHTETQKHKNKKVSSFKEQNLKKQTRSNKNSEKIELEKVKKEGSSMITEKEEHDSSSNKNKINMEQLPLETKEGKVMLETTEKKASKPSQLQQEKSKIKNDTKNLDLSKTEVKNLKVAEKLENDTNAIVATIESKLFSESLQFDIKKSKKLRIREKSMNGKGIANKNQKKKEKSKSKTKSKNGKSKAQAKMIEKLDQILRRDTNFFIHAEDIASIPLPDETQQIRVFSHRNVLDKIESAGLPLENIEQEESNNNQAPKEKIDEEEDNSNKSVLEKEKSNIWTIDKIISTDTETKSKLKEKRAEVTNAFLQYENVTTEGEFPIHTNDVEEHDTNVKDTPSANVPHEFDNVVTTQKSIECSEEPLPDVAVEERPLDLSYTYTEGTAQEEDLGSVKTSATSYNDDNCKMVTAVEILKTFSTSESVTTVEEKSSVIDETGQSTNQEKSASVNSKTEEQNFDIKNVNIFSRVKLKRRYSIATDTCLTREQVDSKHIKKKVLEKYNIECKPHKKFNKTVVKSSESNTLSENCARLETNESAIRKEVSVQLDKNESDISKEISIQLETNQSDKLCPSHTDDEIAQSKSNQIEHGEDRQSSDDDVVLVSVEKLPGNQGQNQEDDYGYDSESMIDKLLEKYSKEKNEDLFDSNARNCKKTSKGKHVRFSMERNTVKRIIPFEGEEENDIPTKKISVDVEPIKNKDKKHDHCQKDVKRRHHHKISEGKTKERKREKALEKTERIGDSAKKDTRKQEKARTGSSTKKSHKNSSKHETVVVDSRKRGRKRDNNGGSPKKIKVTEKHVSKCGNKSNEKSLLSEDAQTLDKRTKKSSKVKHSHKVSKTLKREGVGKHKKSLNISEDKFVIEPIKTNEKDSLEPVQSDMANQNSETIVDKSIDNNKKNQAESKYPLENTRAINAEVAISSSMTGNINEHVSADEEPKNTVFEDQNTLQEKIVDLPLPRIKECNNTECEDQKTVEASLPHIEECTNEDLICVNSTETEDKNSLQTQQYKNEDRDSGDLLPVEVVETPISQLEEYKIEDQNTLQEKIAEASLPHVEEQNSLQENIVEVFLPHVEDQNNADQNLLQEEIIECPFPHVEECKNEDENSFLEEIIEAPLPHVEERKNEDENSLPEELIEAPFPHVEERKNEDENLLPEELIEAPFPHVEERKNEDENSLPEELIEAPLLHVEERKNEDENLLPEEIIEAPLPPVEERKNEEQNSLPEKIIEIPLPHVEERKNEEQNSLPEEIIEITLPLVEERKNEDENSLPEEIIETPLPQVEERKNEEQNSLPEEIIEIPLPQVEERKNEEQNSLPEEIIEIPLSHVEESKNEDENSLPKEIIEAPLPHVEERKNEEQNSLPEKIIEIPLPHVDERKNEEQNSLPEEIIEITLPHVEERKNEDDNSLPEEIIEAPLSHLEERKNEEQNSLPEEIIEIALPHVEERKNEDENSLPEEIVGAPLPHVAKCKNEDQNSLQEKIVETPLPQVVESNNEVQKKQNPINKKVEKHKRKKERTNNLKKKRESKRIDVIIEHLRNKNQKLENTENDIAAIIHSKIDHEEHVRSDNSLVEDDLNDNEGIKNDLDKTDEAESFFSEFNLDQSKLQVSQCEDIFPYIEGSKKDDCLLEIDSNEIATSLAENSVSLLDVNKQVDGADASTSCEITDNLIAVMFSEQNRSNKAGFIYFKGSDHNYHSMGDPLLGGECDSHESDHSSSDNKEISSPELENVLVNDTILPYISTLTDNHQESSEDSGADFQLLELIGNTLARESSPPLTQTINCDNLYQPNLKQVELEYDETSTPNGVDFSRISSEVFINQFQQQTMSVENMSELMNVVLTSLQNLNNMTKPSPNLQDSRESLFLPSDLDDVMQQSQPQNLDLICDFPQTQTTDLNLECSTPVQELEYTNEQYIPVPVQNSSTIEDTSHKKVIVEHIPQYIEQQPPEEVILEKPPTPVKVTTSKSKFSEAIALVRQNRTSSTSPKKLLNHVGFVRSSSKTKPSAPKPKKLSEPKKEPTQEVRTPVKLKTSETPTTSSTAKNVTSSPPKERSLPIIDDLSLNTKKADVKISKVKEDQKILPTKQSPAYAKSPRTPRQSDQKIESTDLIKAVNQNTKKADVKISKVKDDQKLLPTKQSPAYAKSPRTPRQSGQKIESTDLIKAVNQNDMIDNVKRRKRKPVDYSSIEKLLETDEYDYPKAQKPKNKKDDNLKAKPREEEAKVKKLRPSDDAVPSTSGANHNTAAAPKSKASIFEDSDDDDIPKKKKQKSDTPFKEEAMDDVFDRLFKEGEVKKVAKSNVTRMSQEAPKLASGNSIFSVDSGLHRKPETTPVKQIGVVNPIPRQSNHIRKELLPSRTSYGPSEENRPTSQYYQYYSERSRRSYPYPSRESRDPRPSSHQGNSRRQEYSTHSNDQRYSSQRSSSSSRSSRSSRHHSNSRSSTEQRGYWFESGNDLSWREDMKKKFPNVFKDEYF